MGPTSAEVVSPLLNRANARRTLFEDGRKKGIEDEKGDRPNFQRGRKDPRLLKTCRAASGTECRFKPQCGGELLLPLGCAKRLVAVHTGAEGGEFMCHERLINPLCPLLG